MGEIDSKIIKFKKYNLTESSRIDQNDVEIEILQELISWSEYNSQFNPTFLYSLEKKLHYNGYITKHQYNALVNIYNGFKVDEFIINEQKVYGED